MQPGATFAGRFTIERPLSSGGMGAVYVAKHVDTGRPVALKVIKSAGADNPELVSRFKKEITALASLTHPNVVTFLDSGVEDGTFYLVMELLSGRSLRAVMREPVPWQRAFHIAADVCRGLAAVHERGLVHRDLKPENIFLVDAVGHDEIAKLIDFGIARLEDNRATGATATATQGVIGTPGYISPEQLQGRTATPASDVYAVGVLLYEMVTGKFPFEAPTTHAMLVKQLMEPLPPPRSLLRLIPEHVDALIMRFMERDPANRVSTAKDALAMLLNAKDAGPSTSLPPNNTRVAPFDVPGSSGAPLSPSPSPPLSPSPSPSSSPSSSPPNAEVAAALAPQRAQFEAGTAPTPQRPLVVPKKRATPALIAAVVGVVVVLAFALRPHPVRTTSGSIAGRYGASYSGVVAVNGFPPGPQAISASADVRELSGSQVLIVLSDGVTKNRCQITLNRSGDTLVYNEQRCNLVNPDGSTQVNTSSGSGTIERNDIVLNVDGNFVGANVMRVPYGGTFHGTWTISR